MKLIIAAFILAGIAENALAQGYSFAQLWYDTNLTAGSDIQTGNYNRSIAYTAISNQLFVANRSGSLEGITVLNATNGSVVGTVYGASTLAPDQILVGDDGILYAIPLDITISANNFAIYSWTNWQTAPHQCYVPGGSDGTGQSLISGYRAGDTAAILGGGSNTLILCGINYGVATTNCAFLFSTADGINFTATLLCITNLPASYSDLGPAHGYSFYTNGTFIFKAGGSSSYLIQYPTNFASLPNPVNVGAIATNSLSGNSVVTDFSAAGNLLAAMQLPQGANNNSVISLCALSSFTGISNVASTDTANPNSNGNDTGGIVLGGQGKTNLLFTLDCNNGVYGWGLVSSSGSGTGVPTPGQLQAELNGTTQGSIINLYGVNPIDCPQISMSQTFDGGRLIFSDSPESPTTTGMLYMDTNLAATAASIPNRVFIYHVNADSSAMLRFSVLIKNTGSSNATLSVRQSGYSGPSTSYGVVGETAFYNWLITTNPAATQTVAPGQVVRLDTNFDTINVRHNDLMNGIWDYTFNQPHAIMVCALTANEDPVVVGPTLPVLARDSHVRGTFTACNKNYDTAASVLLNTTAGIQQFPIAGSSDAFVTGYDNAVSPPTAQTNSGNYGVFYNIQLNTSASDGRALGILINPQGGAWSGAANAGPGILPGGDFIIPTNGLTISAATNAAVAGEYFPNGGATVQLQFMPTGASSFPVYVMTVPYASSAPDLAAISNYTINAGQTVNFTTSVGDPNGTPPLNFSLPQAPAGASIGSVSGVFSWRAPIASAGTMQSVQVAVSDSGSPPFNDAQTFSISVNPLSPVTANAKSLGANSIQLQVSGPVGPDYILQGNTNLSNPGGWLSILTNTPSTTPFYLTETNADNFSDRYYRILLGPL